MLDGSIKITTVKKYKKNENGKLLYFDSGIDSINNFLYYNSHGEEEIATTHLMINNQTNKIIGFVALKNAELIMKNIYDNKQNIIEVGYPAIEIYQIGVDEKYQNKGYGTILIKYVFGLCKEINQKYSKIDYIVLHSIKDVVKFYKGLNFRKIKDNKNEILKNKDTGACIPMYAKLDNY